MRLRLPRPRNLAKILRRRRGRAACTVGGWVTGAPSEENRQAAREEVKVRKAGGTGGAGEGAGLRRGLGLGIRVGIGVRCWMGSGLPHERQMPPTATVLRTHGST